MEQDVPKTTAESVSNQLSESSAKLMLTSRGCDNKSGLKTTSQANSSDFISTKSFPNQSQVSGFSLWFVVLNLHSSLDVMYNWNPLFLTSCTIKATKCYISLLYSIVFQWCDYFVVKIFRDVTVFASYDVSWEENIFYKARLFIIQKQKFHKSSLNSLWPSLIEFTSITSYFAVELT